MENLLETFQQNLLENLLESIKTRIRVSHEPQLRSTDGPLLMVSPSRLLSQHILISFHSTIDSIYPYTLYETLRRIPRSKINLARWDPRNSLTHEVPMSQQCPRHGSFIIRKHHHCMSTYILDDRMTDQSFLRSNSHPLSLRKSNSSFYEKHVQLAQKKRHGTPTISVG